MPPTRDERKRLVADGYDRMADRYGAWAAQIEGDPRDRMIAEMTRRLPLNGRLLDLGCGSGVPSTKVLAEQFDVVGDLAKGAVPVLIARIATGGDSLAEVLVAAAAVAGSVRSIFLNFSGGRGVGTGVGTMLVIQPLAVVLAAPVFFLAILATRYVSLGSLLGSAAMFPATLLIWAVASGLVPPAYLVWAAVGPILIWVAHADNIDRLLHGTERKFDLGLITGGRRRGGA